MVPKKSKVLFVPKIYGFKIYNKEGSAFREGSTNKKVLTEENKENIT